MAKGNGVWWKTLIAAAVLLVSVASSYTFTKAKGDANEKAITNVKEESKEHTNKLEEDGCDPARDLKEKYGVVEYRLDAIDEKMGDLATEQRAMRRESDKAFGEILKRLPK